MDTPDLIGTVYFCLTQGGYHIITPLAISYLGGFVKILMRNTVTSFVWNAVLFVQQENWKLMSDKYVIKNNTNNTKLNSHVLKNDKEK